MKKLISIIIPVYNEASNIDAFYNALAKVLNELNRFNFELIYVNDGSSDESFSKISDLLSKDRRIVCINFSRNFGKEAATTAGIHNASGEAIIMIDADGQHPAAIIPKFIQSWEDGNQVVVGVRISNRGEGAIKKYGSKIFYKVLSLITDGSTKPGSTDFRLIDRKVINEFNKFTERGRITRGLIDWLGFKRDYIEFEANERINGSASYGIGKLTRLALHAFVSQSTKPLQAVGVLGLIVTVLSAILGVALIVETYLLGDPLSLAITGTAILAVFLSFLVGVVLACQGLLALYVESIHNETQNRPLYVIESKTKS